MGFQEDYPVSRCKCSSPSDALRRLIQRQDVIEQRGKEAFMEVFKDFVE